MKTNLKLLLAGAAMVTLLLSACEGGPYQNNRSSNLGGYSGFNSGFRGLSSNYGGYPEPRRTR